MKIIYCTFNVSIREPLIQLLEENGVQEYQLIEEVLARPLKAMPRFNTPVWPGYNSALIMQFQEDQEAGNMLDIIKEYNRIGSAFGNTKGRNSVYNYLTDLEQVGLITRTDGSSGSVRHDLQYPENAVLKKVDDNLLELLRDAGIVSEYEGEYSISNRQ